MLWGPWQLAGVGPDSICSNLHQWNKTEGWGWRLHLCRHCPLAVTAFGNRHTGMRSSGIWCGALSSLSPWVSVTLQMLSLGAWTSLPLVLMHLLCYTTRVHRGQCFLFLGNLLCLFATQDSKELSVGLPLMKCTSTVFSTATVLSHSVYQSCLEICAQDLHFCKGKTFFSHRSHSSSISLSESSPWALDNAAFTPAFPFPFFPLLCFITK